MKKLIAILLFLPIGFTFAQRIGELAPPKPPEIFPDNSWGVDLMFGEGGFGLGTFYRRTFSLNLSGFIDLSISETKDEREMEYYDPWYGITYSPNKANRAFLLPVTFGIQYRLFDEALTENLRPYLTAGVGPTFVVSTPYEEEFFSSFKYAKLHTGFGGYIGFGANMGTSKSNLVGLNVRYYYTHLFGDGVENMIGTLRKEFGQFSLSLNVGIMY